MVNREKTGDLIPLREFLEASAAANKQYFEARVEWLEKHWAAIEVEKERARQVALIELERRLETLNHAHQRAAEVLSTYLSRESWEKFKEEDMIWKRQSDVLRSTWVTQAEFHTYKETTQTALTLSAGKRQGIGAVWGAVAVGFSTLAAIGSIVTALNVFLKHP